jgi:transposase InsO family protein
MGRMAAEAVGSKPKRKRRSFTDEFKFELGERFASYAAVKEQLFDYVEVFYNQKRKHSAIAYKSPAQHEREFRSIQLAA